MFKRCWLAGVVAVAVLCGQGRALTIARDGKAACAIVVAEGASKAEQTAAKELAEHLKQVTGAEFEIRATSGEGAEIVVGQAGARALLPDVKWEALGHDGIVMRSMGQKLVLAGGQPRGSLYAVYTFLEDVVGVRWWTSSESFVPKKPTLEMGELNTVYVPKLKYRETFNGDVLNKNYVQAARLKLNGHFSAIPAEWGGHYNIIGWCHTCMELLPPGTYFGKHPEWYAFDGKQRQGTQLCWSNPEMQKELAKNVLARIAKNPEAGIISVSQADGWGQCLCAECKKIDDAEGTQAGSLITGINYVAGEVEKVYPDFLVETLAYVYSRHAPKTIKPAKNVLVRLCSIECDFTKPIDGPSNKDFAEDLHRWAEISTNLFIWNYVTNFNNYLQPHPNMTNLGHDIRAFVDNKCVGLFQQGDAPNWGVGDMLPLRCWLLAKLMWNPQADQEKLTKEFLDGYYGAAGPYLKQYLDVVNSVAADPKFRLGCGAPDARFISDEKLKQCEELFAQADAAVAADAVLARRVDRQKTMVEHVRLQRYPFLAKVAEFEKAGKSRDEAVKAMEKEYRRAVQSWCQRVRGYGVVNLSEPQGFDSYEPGLFLAYDRVIPPKLPKPGEAIGDNAIELQEDKFTLHYPGQFSELKEDAKASNGKAAWMPGGHTNWAIQCAVPKDPRLDGKSNWRCYLVVRMDGKVGEGTGFIYGVHPVSFNWGGQQHNDAEYHAYGIYLKNLKPGDYFWMAPSGPVNGLYLDRIYMVKDEEQ